MARTDTYNEIRTINFPNAIVRMHFPEISDEENKRRYDIVMDAAAKLIFSMKETNNDRASTQSS